MIRNYLTIALRNLWRRKLYTGLNVGGLAIGLAACLLMALYVEHEFSYDRSWVNADRIVRVTTHMKTPESPLNLAVTPKPLADVLKRDYPEVETAVRFQPVDATVRSGDKLLKEANVYYADADGLTVFAYPLLAGDPRRALRGPNSAVITESIATKYFGDKGALGRLIQINKATYKVTGVMADLPSNVDLPISILLASDFSGARDWMGEDFPNYTYVLFRRPPYLADFQKKLDRIAAQYMAPEFKKIGADGYSARFEAEPLTQVHYSGGRMADTPKGNRQFGDLFLFLAVFVLAIALLNYINLLTARATERAKEVGVRKANGAQRTQLMGQFLLESGLLSGLAVAGAFALTEAVIPSFNELLAIQLRPSFAWMGLLVGATWIVTTLLGGLYPAFVLSGYRPVEVLKGRLGAHGSGLWLRRSVIVFQFVLAVGMIAGVLIVRGQMNYLQRHELGFTKEQVLSVFLPDDSLARAQAVAFGNSLRQQTEVKDVSVGSGLQINAMLPIATTFIRTGGKKREVMSNYLFVDDRFLPLLKIKLKEGRNLVESAADQKGGFLVNEAFMKLAGWQKGVGQTIEGFEHKGQVVGVVRDFNYRSLHHTIEPLVMVYNTFPANNVVVKIRPEALSVVEAAWQQHYPDFPFQYQFVDETFNAQYHKDQMMMTVFNGFALLTVLVSCLGLFGLTVFTAEQRTKEIGVRKVLGASVAGIVTLLTRDLIKLILIATVLGSGIAWYAMNQWLEAFAYRIAIPGSAFLLAGGLILLIALLTVSFQSIKAALANPVESLRSE